MGKRNLESSDGWERCKADRGQKPDGSQKGWEKGTELMEGGVWAARDSHQRVLESLNFIKIMYV